MWLKETVHAAIRRYTRPCSRIHAPEPAPTHLFAALQFSVDGWFLVVTGDDVAPIYPIISTTAPGLRAEGVKHELTHFHRVRPGSPAIPLGPPTASHRTPILRVNPSTLVPRPSPLLLHSAFSFRQHMRFYATKAARTVSASRMLGDSVCFLQPVYRCRLHISYPL